MKILKPTDPIELFHQFGGGKATHLRDLTELGFNVPPWICVSSQGMAFLKTALFKEALKEELKSANLLDDYVAVRSSGIGEDSSTASFAGIHSSYLYQKGLDAILNSIEKCLESCFSERALDYRLQQGLSTDTIETGVVIQKMVDSEISGVAFSRNPLGINGADQVVLNAVWGIGEGLVGGEIEGDLFTIERSSFDVVSKPAQKEKIYLQGSSGALALFDVAEEKQSLLCLTPTEAKEIAKLSLKLEEHYGHPQDVEWAFSEGKLYCLQTRAITTLPSSAYYKVNDGVSLWDNSNIVESFSGVTTPLTFSFASSSYEEVYRQFCETIAVPKVLIRAYEPVFSNMLGYLRGRIYYNLVNWYRLAVLLPGASKNQGFMETMMGVKQALSSELAEKIGFPKGPPKIPFFSRAKLLIVSLWRFFKIDSIVARFQTHFNEIYSKAKKRDFEKLSLSEISQFYQELKDKILKRWQAPIINDCICMIFFGLLKKLTEEWIGSDDPSLQNDLLCGEGGLESAEPTKMLMRISKKIDEGDPQFRQWYLETPSENVMENLQDQSPQVHKEILAFLEKFGFRCVDELKLESQDLHDDPSFIIEAIGNYVRMKTYSLTDLEEREKKIRKSAEERAFSALKGLKKGLYKFVLKNARRAIRDRENMRFSRTKIFGVVRHLFRAVGTHFTKLGILNSPRDIFYLKVEEILAYIEGRTVDLNLKEIVKRRQGELAQFKKSAPPPDRFITIGPAGLSQNYPQLLASYNLDISTHDPENPNTLKGTPCSPGIVEGVVRVVRDLKEAKGLNGEILVTERTDPGWVPLYPSCSGLLIERGSLLSHSAVVARELGLPTIVGISGGLMQKLETGMRVKMDAAKGIVEIL